MMRYWIGRTAAALALGASALLLVSCGSGVVSDLDAKRIIVVGDSFSDVGQGPTGTLYTVNDDTRNWIQHVAQEEYGLKVKPEVDGGWGYAQGYARVASPDAIGGSPSVKEQIDAVLARTKLHPTEDLFFISGGMHDIVAAVENLPEKEWEKAVEKAAGDLAKQVHRVVKEGGRHVVVLGVYNICVSPWGHGEGLRGGDKQEDYRSCIVNVFNTRLLTELADLVDNQVHYLEPASFFNRMYYDHKDNSIDNRKDPACSTPDASTCTPATAKGNYNNYLFADGLHITPRLQRWYADTARSELSYRW